MSYLWTHSRKRGDQPLKNGIGLRRRGPDRDDPPGARNATRGDELGNGAKPAALKESPFHRFGVRMNNKAETMRDRRLLREEEKLLLDSALQKMNTGEHLFVGALLHDRIIGALELWCRRGEMLLIQNKRVNWETCQIGILGTTAKDKRTDASRSIPRAGSRRSSSVDRPRWTGRVRLRNRDWRVPTEHPDRLGNSLLARTWHRATDKALSGTAGSFSGSISAGTTSGMKGARRLLADRRRHSDHPADAWPREHPADATLPKRDG